MESKTTNTSKNHQRSYKYSQCLGLRSWISSRWAECFTSVPATLGWFYFNSILQRYIVGVPPLPTGKVTYILLKIYTKMRGQKLQHLIFFFVWPLAVFHVCIEGNRENESAIKSLIDRRRVKVCGGMAVQMVGRVEISPQQGLEEFCADVYFCFAFIKYVISLQIWINEPLVSSIRYLELYRAREIVFIASSWLD